MKLSCKFSRPSIPGAHATFGDTIGNCELAAWLVAPGTVWVQTRSPDFARKLARRGDGRLVAVGVAGGFLRTFCFRQPLRWARTLIARYTADKTGTNARLFEPESRLAKGNF